MDRNQANNEYLAAQKLGQREYWRRMIAGQYPYLQVLEDLLQNTETEGQLPLGLVEIPLNRVVGTRTAGRKAAFAANFMPLLDANTEFASKWVNLCAAHLEEGIRDPIHCIEYMGLFYVEEGNKRTSVLRYFNAGSVTANVTRVLPRWNDSQEVRLYYEFLEAWPSCKTYYLTFSQTGSYARFQKAIGKRPDEAWTDEDRKEVHFLLQQVEKACAGKLLRATAGDVLLLLLRRYPYKDMVDCTPAKMEDSIQAVWDDILAMESPDPVKVSTAPATPAENNLLDKILPKVRSSVSRLQIAFVNERTPQTSAWTNQHEFGRNQLEKTFSKQVTTIAYNNAIPHQNADELVEKAIEEGADVVFTTSPQLVGASLRAAAKHPKVRILNCSLDMPYASIRTYYTRVYEAKFITGAIAGAMSDSNRIGYISSYPNFGAPACINAFALGARMSNPRARIILTWSCLPGDPLQQLVGMGLNIISGHDAPVIGRPQKEFGTFQIVEGGTPLNLAAPFWHWGQFYINVVRTILDGSWSRDKSGVDGRAVNYWWGMNSGVLDVLFSRELPDGVRHLAEILRHGVISGGIDPFTCHIVAQDGKVKNDGSYTFTPEQLLRMDWLCDAVDGVIPEYDDLAEYAKPMYRLQGIHRDLLPAEKEAVL